MNIRVTQIGRNSAVRTRIAHDVQTAVAMLRHCTRYGWSDAEAALVFEVVAPHPHDCRAYIVHGETDAVHAVFRAAKAMIDQRKR